MRLHLAPLAVLVASCFELSLPAVLIGGIQENAKIAIHVKAPATKTGTICTSWAPSTGCSQYNTSGRVGVDQYVYLVVGNASRQGFRGVEFGIDYDPTLGMGVDVYDWILCADAQITHEGPNGLWPAAGSGIWGTWGTCQSNWIEPNGVHAVIGVLRVYAYSADTLKISGHPSYPGGCVRTHSIAVADCSSNATVEQLNSGPLSFAVFSPNGDVSGYNPCPNTAMGYPELDRDNPILLEVQVGDTATGFLRLTNAGTGPLSGTILASGPDYSVAQGGGPYVLQSGESRIVRPQLLPSSLGLKRGQLIVSDEWPAFELWGVAICGDSSDIVVTPKVLDFGDVPVGSTREMFIHVSNRADCASALIRPKNTNSSVFSCCFAAPFLVEPLQTVDIPVTFTPLAAGVETHGIGFEGSHKWSIPSNPPPGVSFRGRGVLTEAVCQVEPSTFEFEPLFVGESRQGTFRVTNDCSGCNELIGEISENSEDLEIISGGGGFSLGPEASRVVTFNFTPSADGYRSGTILVATNAQPECPPVVVSGLRQSPVEATNAWFEPGTLNTVAPKPWIKALIELPAPYSPDQIQIRSVTAFDSIPADSTFFEVADRDSNGVLDGAVRFSRPALIQYVSSSADSLTVPITGDLGEVAVFTAEPTLRIVRPRIIRPHAGDMLIAGSFQPVLWDAPWPVTHAWISFSLDGGSEWTLAGQVAGAETYMWQVPPLETHTARLRVALYDDFGLLGFGDTPEFGISQPVGIGTPAIEPARLLQNSPNPFSQSTRIDFTLLQESKVVLQVFDVKGQLVRVLGKETTTAGSHWIFWDGRDASGRTVSDGVYLYHLKAAGLDQTRRMLKVGS